MHSTDPADQYGSTRICMGQYWVSTGSVLGQYWVSMGQYGSERICMDLYGSARVCTRSVQDQYRSPPGRARSRAFRTRSLRNHYKAQADLYNSNKSVQDQYMYSTRSVLKQDQYRSVRDHRGASEIRCIPYKICCTDLVISRTDLVQTRADPYRSIQIRSDPY